MAAILNYDVTSAIIRPRQPMRIHSGNKRSCHPDPIWNDGVLDFLKMSPQQEQQQEQGD